MKLAAHTDRDILLISMFTFITVISWIAFEFVKTIKTTTVNAPIQQLITPLDPKIDTEVLTLLEQRKVY